MAECHTQSLAVRRTRWRHCTHAAWIALLVLSGACDQAAVRWVDDSPVASNAPSPLLHPPFVPVDSALRDDAPIAELLLTQDLLRETSAQALLSPTLVAMSESRTPAAAGEVPATTMTMSMSPPAPDQSLGTGDAPTDTLRCARSLRVALAPGRGRVAAWWTRRTGGRVVLVAAWRDTLVAQQQLGAWRGPIVVDSLDQGPSDAQAAERGGHGCARSAPSVAVDDAHGYVHVAYAMMGPEGAGVFYAHQMDPRAGFETPRVILYGDRLGNARVATTGDVVVVAYDDPNGGERPRIGVAVSRTSGHTFDDRLIASSKMANASDPYVVTSGRAIVVGWSEIPSGGGDPIFSIRRATIR